MLSSSLYRVVHQTPTIEAYRHLRQASGLSPKALEAAERGLPNSLFSVQVLCDGEPVAMGRVIGDGGCFYQVVDIAVLPAHQGRGLGKTVMGEIASYIVAPEKPPSSTKCHRRQRHGAKGWPS
ncbi:GNAT family N-acetyltransferase, partial [Xanthomonas campestris pv. campestris]|uniref:GNAT family N-acetyltransferase n=1 Tax=Xanthomonas campestris TaxID=339 RepID=UPI002AD34891